MFPSQKWKNEVKVTSSVKQGVIEQQGNTHTPQLWFHSCLAPALQHKLFIHSNRNTLQLLAQNSKFTASVLLGRTKGKESSHLIERRPKEVQNQQKKKSTSTNPSAQGVSSWKDSLATPTWEHMHSWQGRKYRASPSAEERQSYCSSGWEELKG